MKNKCIYCGREILYGSACNSCAELYLKKRRRSGGYPSHDPYSNINRYNDKGERDRTWHGVKH